MHVRCTKCEHRIAQGVRFNANKKKVGNYLSTPIYEFRMHCINCMNPLCIKTDPQNSAYIMQEGLRKCAGWEGPGYNLADGKTGGGIELPDPETKHKMQQDPMFRLEMTH